MCILGPKENKGTVEKCERNRILVCLGWKKKKIYVQVGMVLGHREKKAIRAEL